jgi:hypothetical protein
MFKVGAKVLADAGSGTRVGFVLDGPDGPENKYVVQIGDIAYTGMTYREPEDRDSGGAGMTFWKI